MLAWLPCQVGAVAEVEVEAQQQEVRTNTNQLKEAPETLTPNLPLEEVQP